MRPGTITRWCALRNILKSEIQERSVVLDLGGYDGHICHNLRKLYPHSKFIIVDMDKQGLWIARDQGLNTLCASALNIPVRDGRADIVLCLSLIEHVEEDGKLVKEIARVLKEHGKLILITPMQGGISFPLLGKKRTQIVNKNWGHVVMGYSLENIRRLLQDANLVIQETSSYFNFPTRLAYRLIFVPRIPLIVKAALYPLYRATILLEPYIKYGAESHIIIGEKIKG